MFRTADLSSGTSDRFFREKGDDVGVVDADDYLRQGFFPSQSSAFVRYGYSKAKSVAAASITSTDSTSSTNTDLSDSFIIDNDKEARLLGEDILESIEEDDFFDCISQASENGGIPMENEVALYIGGRCIYPDGHPAYVLPGTCVLKVPKDLIEFCHGDNEKAGRMWKDIHAWRQENDIWKIHTKPNMWFRHAKQYYPSCFHGYTKSDHLVVEYSFPGQMDANALLPDIDVMNEILLHHYFMQEYISKCMYVKTSNKAWYQLGKEAPCKTGESTGVGFLIIIDLQGAGLHHVTSKVLSFLKRLITCSSAYYPTLAKRCLIINAPFWVAGVFGSLKHLLPATMPVEIVSEQATLDALRKHIDDDQIPKEYGGSNDYALHRHPFEQNLHDFVDKVQLEATGREADNDLMLDKELSNQDIQVRNMAETCHPVPRKGSKGGTASSSCMWNPLHGITCYSREPKFRIVNEPEHLMLSPKKPSFDFFSLARNFFKSMMYGFMDCSDHILQGKL